MRQHGGLFCIERLHHRVAASRVSRILRIGHPMPVAGIVACRGPTSGKNSPVVGYDHRSGRCSPGCTYRLRANAIDPQHGCRGAHGAAWVQKSGSQDARAVHQ